jgi:TolB protein
LRIFLLLFAGKLCKVRPVKVSMHFLAVSVAVFCLLSHTRPAAGAGLVVFDGDADVGSVSRAGSVSFDATNRSYIVSGSGANMWGTNDAFHFVWKRISGDFALRSAIKILGSGGDPHRKACLIARQGLEPDAPYVDVALHGEGLLCFQYRESRGAVTREIQALQHSPTRIGLERQGQSFFLSIAADSKPYEPAGPALRLAFKEPLYVGLAVCAHNEEAIERAQFSELELIRGPANGENKPVLHSMIEVIDILSRARRVIYHTTNLIEAPNWARDGLSLLFNGGGKLFRIPSGGGEPQVIDTGFATHCNNDHGLSPAGGRLAISDSTKGGKSLIYVLASSGGPPRLVTTNGPSYWHGWSPDGKTLSFCGQRDGEFDVYTIPFEGGVETRLTTTPGLDDGPEYSPDGKHIYFNSERSGLMQIWRMKPDGNDQEQVTRDELNNWFPHPSPDGKWIAMLSYEKEVVGHPANKPVRLRLMPANGGAAQSLTHLFGGQGTINVPSWSPDSKKLAFVSYELLKP